MLLPVHGRTSTFGWRYGPSLNHISRSRARHLIITAKAPVKNFSAKLRECSFKFNELKPLLISHLPKLDANGTILAVEAVIRSKKGGKQAEKDAGDMLDKLFSRLQSEQLKLNVTQITRCLVCLTKHDASNKQPLIRVWMSMLRNADGGALQNCNLETLSHLAYATTKLPDAYEPRLMDAIASQSSALMQQWHTTEIDETVDEPHFTTTGQKASSSLRATVDASTIAARHVGQLLWAFATHQHYYAALMSTCLKVLPGVCHQFDPFALVQVMWALTNLGTWDGHMTQAFAAQVEQQVERLAPPQLATCMWVLAAMQLPGSSPVFRLLSQALSCTPVDTLTRTSLFQIAHAIALLNPSTLRVDMLTMETVPVMNPALKAAALAAWSDQLYHVTTSTLHLEVLQVLRSMGWDAQPEHKTADGMFSVDIAVGWRSSMYALEVDGPDHFFANMPTKPLGGTCIRDNALEARGWQVLKVEYFTWDTLQSQEEKELFLCELFHENAVQT